MKCTRAVVVVDGASHGNPGPSAAAAILWLSREAWQAGRLSAATQTVALGDATNNVAEHKAIQLGLELAHDVLVGDGYVCGLGLIVYSDSKLAVKQIKGDWQTHKPHLAKLVAQTRDLEREHFPPGFVTFKHVPRRMTAAADVLAQIELRR